MNRVPPSSRGGGFTLVEGMISFTVFALLLSAFMRSFEHFNQLTEQTSREYQANAQTIQALSAISEELERSAYVTVGGIAFPRLIEGVDQVNRPVVFGHAPPSATEGDNIASNDLWYVLPFDGDGDGWPDLDAARSPVWDPTTYALMLVPDGTGTNDLVRRSSAGAQTVLARHVSSIRFEDPVAASWEIPLETLRVRIVTALPTERGGAMTRRSETVISLRNGRFVP